MMVKLVPFPKMILRIPPELTQEENQGNNISNQTRHRNLRPPRGASPPTQIENVS